MSAASTANGNSLGAVFSSVDLHSQINELKHDMTASQIVLFDRINSIHVLSEEQKIEARVRFGSLLKWYKELFSGVAESLLREVQMALEKLDSRVFEQLIRELSAIKDPERAKREERAKIEAIGKHLDQQTRQALEVLSLIAKLCSACPLHEVQMLGHTLQLAIPVAKVLIADSIQAGQEGMIGSYDWVIDNRARILITLNFLDHLTIQLVHDLQRIIDRLHDPKKQL